MKVYVLVTGEYSYQQTKGVFLTAQGAKDAWHPVRPESAYHEKYSYAWGPNHPMAYDNVIATFNADVTDAAVIEEWEIQE